LVAPLAGCGDELSAVVLAEIEIEEDDIDGGAAEDIESLAGGSTGSGDFKIGLGGEEAAEAVAEKKVIID
jgi:hypothetical protein